MTTTGSKDFENRWRMSRAGMVNVWHYIDTEFTLSGGRLILRGSNGSGKSRALEMLLPFLLDADRRRMDATGSQKVSLDELMHTGIGNQTNRVGYLWLELSRPGAFLTLGAHIRYSASAKRSEVNYFTTERRVGHDLNLVADNREPLARDQLAELVGAHRLGDAEQHREAVRTRVFGLHGEFGRDRFTGLMQLLHTLRSPDVGNRIDEGKLPQILSDALPPLSEQMLEAAGDRLDDLSETRLAQSRLSDTLEHAREFHDVYRRYAATTLTAGAASLEGVIDAVDGAVGAHRDRITEAAELAGEQTSVNQQISELTEERDTLKGAIEVLSDRPELADADDLKLRDEQVLLLRRIADTALVDAERARGAEQALVESVERGLGAVDTAVREAVSLLSAAKDGLVDIGLTTGELPDTFNCDRATAGAVTAVVMDSLDGPPVSITRPSLPAWTLEPSDLSHAAESARRSAEAAYQRGRLVERRIAEARRLDSTLARVLDQENRAEEAEGAAESQRNGATRSAQERDELAIDLNRRWREWVSAPDTTRIIPGAAWPPAVSEVLTVDLEALCGDSESDDVLDELDAAPERAAIPVREELAVQSRGLVDEQRADDLRRVDLSTRRGELLDEHDPEPPVGPLHRVHSGVPLWSAVDFQPHLTAEERAGIEAALLASGLLTATVALDATVQAEDGEILLTPIETVANSPLSTALCPDPAADVPSDLIASILARVGLHDQNSRATIGTDGSWQNGSLSGRHTQPKALYIGGAARAANREAELAHIEIQLDELTTAAEDRKAAHAEINRRRGELDSHLATAPRTRKLALQRQAARLAERRAAEAEEDAHTQRRTATEARAGWSKEFQTHSRQCDSAGLPVAVEQLAAIEKQCRNAEQSCRALEKSIQETIKVANRLIGLPEQHADAQTQRETAELEAESRRRDWVRDASDVAARHAALDLSVREILDELGRSKKAQKNTMTKLDDLGRRKTSLISKCTLAEHNRDLAEEEVRHRIDELRTTGIAFDARLRLPGLAAAASEVDVERVADVTDRERIRGVIRVARTAWKVSKPVGLNQLIAALRRFETGVSGQLDVTHHVESDVYLVHIEGAEEHHDCTAVLNYLIRRDEQGRAALSERERKVFTEFVLGGVADELRRRVEQADALMKAMDGSLAGVRTSHGIGVSIAWSLDTADPELQRLIGLVKTNDAVRSDDGDEELVALIRHRVEQLHAADSSVGYTAHLRTALDYRVWHAVEVTILGPESNQRRRISKRAKISQGETRFVSYVALFAAADGFLSGLPSSDQALRLVLLDDAFAKVDERAIGELMGLLVRMDIDFVMTGHALWGTVPEVPALDIYEIRRIGGSAVIPTWIQWNGRKKTFMQVVRPA
ncbi:TIGR02680 family protein [Nocardia sp. NPDC057272]|uniref:TIGR02680 family protein n=1 Tax=Nocardia sp. NPDC057272 TaxID=3346079 RepID=UPI0036457802